MHKNTLIRELCNVYVLNKTKNFDFVAIRSCNKEPFAMGFYEWMKIAVCKLIVVGA